MLIRTLRAALCCWVFLSPALTRAEVPFPQRLSLRYSAGASLMLSADQRSWLGYSAPGVLSDLQLAVRLSPLLAAQLGVAGGIFFSSVVNGAVLAPMLGGTLHWPLAGLPTYGALNVGVAVTGELLRPFARAVIGVDWSVSSQLTLGPVLGLDWVTQRDGSVYSSDAIYGWVGISLGYRPVRFAPKLAQKAPIPEPEPIGPAPPPLAAEVAPEQPAPVHEPLPPSPELDALLDGAVDAVHVSRTELLAPVLFHYDSVELEPSSVAMLHEVARMLNQERKQIELLAVIAYSDNQGSAEYNLELSGRRAAHVRDWLVAHGVAAERLTVEARGASEPVEVGERADQQQNRRVIFRVLREEARP
ncbi:MAG TPA: OmpA family protein [Polyangiales bacterium]|nr:OmpA family protein [Polyangiales bacterium]